MADVPDSEAAWLLRLVDQLYQFVVTSAADAASDYAEFDGQMRSARMMMNGAWTYLAAAVDGAVDGGRWPEPFASELSTARVALQTALTGDR